MRPRLLERRAVFLTAAVVYRTAVLFADVPVVPRQTWCSCYSNASSPHVAAVQIPFPMRGFPKQVRHAVSSYSALSESLSRGPCPIVVPSLCLRPTMAIQAPRFQSLFQNSVKNPIAECCLVQTPHVRHLLAGRWPKVCFLIPLNQTSSNRPCAFRLSWPSCPFQ